MEGLACIEIRFCIGSAPIDCVLYDAVNVLVLQGVYRLVTCVEVEDFTETASEGKSASEDIAILKPSAEDDLIGLRNIERLAVELLGKLEAHRNAFCYRMPRSKVPYDRLLVSSPSEVSCASDYALEGLRMMC